MADAEKRYPFPMAKYGHDVEFAYNRLKNAVSDMEHGETPWDDKTVDSLEELEPLYENCICEPVYFATAKEYELLQNIVEWAHDTRIATQAQKKGFNRYDDGR